MIVWTLKSCDTCRKALKWLTENGIDHAIVDVREDGLERDTVAQIVKALGAENAVNRRSTTWRNLASEQREGLDETSAIELILANPTLMKRPVFIRDNSIFAGFTDATKTKITD
jgi:Spx/MgsR family transcriptional regulator